MLSSPLFREGDTVTPCMLSTHCIHMLYDPMIQCGYDDRFRMRYYNRPSHIHMRRLGYSVQYYHIDIDELGYSWTDQSFAEAQPIFRYLNWEGNEY